MPANQVDLTDGRAVELKFPDGSVLRLRWDKDMGMVKVSAETCGDILATRLAILPWAANCIMLEATAP